MEVFVVVAVTIILFVYIYYRRSFQYWNKKGIVTIEPSIPFGNFGNPFAEKSGFIFSIPKLYREFKVKGVQCGGLYSGPKPVLLVVHPEMLKNVLSKDFHHFSSHGGVSDEKVEPLLANLFNMEGNEWKSVRVKLTPTFTSGKMKMMFYMLLNCGKQLEDFLDISYAQNIPLDIKEILACYMTDVIGSCAFGVECNSFKDPNAHFRTHGKRLFRPSLKFQLRRALGMISPRLVKIMKLYFVDKDVEQYFIEVVRDMVNFRKYNKVTRNDFMQLMIDMNERSKLEGEEPFSIKQIAAHSFMFFSAGFEASSAVTSFALYELAYDQDIQDKLREEIKGIMKKYNGELTYNGMMEMKYLNQTINETLRKYPPLHTLFRRCTQTYTLPNGSEIENGTRILISTLGLHMDEEYFPNPEKFDPDRFSEENKHNIVPYTFLPFGEGPRICIGLRFGMMQAKVAIGLILNKYVVFPHKSVKYPLEFDIKLPTLSTKGTILLTIQKA